VVEAARTREPTRRGLIIVAVIVVVVAAVVVTVARADESG
jgi:hypothetical protein